jgi:hypothetical protein
LGVPVTATADAATLSGPTSTPSGTGLSGDAVLGAALAGVVALAALAACVWRRSCGSGWLSAPRTGAAAAAAAAAAATEAAVGAGGVELALRTTTAGSAAEAAGGEREGRKEVANEEVYDDGL